MELMVNGAYRLIPSSVLGKLEVQYDELLGALKKRELTLDEWILSCQGDKVRIATLLKISHLYSLSTDIGVAYLFTKIPFPCPMGH